METYFLPAVPSWAIPISIWSGAFACWIPASLPWMGSKSYFFLNVPYGLLVDDFPRPAHLLLYVRHVLLRGEEYFTEIDVEGFPFSTCHLALSPQWYLLRIQNVSRGKTSQSVTHLQITWTSCWNADLASLSLGGRWVPRLGISIKLPGDADSSDLQATFWVVWLSGTSGWVSPIEALQGWAHGVFLIPERKWSMQ